MIYFILHIGITKTSLPLFLQNHKVKYMKLDDMDLITLLPDPLPVLTEGMLLRASSKREVYWLQNTTLNLFPSLKEFIKYGFDFDQVVVVMDWVVPIISPGPDVH